MVKIKDELVCLRCAQTLRLVDEPAKDDGDQNDA